MTNKAKANCLCGRVDITVNALNTEVGACHCRTCQQWAGGPLMAVNCGSEVEMTPTESITVYSSSEWAERGFCNNCGSHLFYRLKQAGQYFIPVGLFDAKEGFVFDHQVFIDEKPDYYNFSNKTKDMTGAEVFAMFNGGSE